MLILAKCYYDLQFFCNFFFKHKNEDGEWEGHVKDPYNKMHLDYFREFNPEEKSVLKVTRASRGSAKTTLLALLDPLHRICFGNEKFILILSSTTPLARGKSKDISREISLNDRLRYFFDMDFASKRVSTETFVVKSVFGECLVHSQGFFSQVRGIKFGASRPTRILYDDIVHGERVFGEGQREKLERHFETDIKHAAQPTTNHIMFGTTIHAEDLLSKKAKDPMWQSKLYPSFIKWPNAMDMWDKWSAIWVDQSIPEDKRPEEARKFYIDNKAKMDEGAEVLWPEREDIYYLMRDRLISGHRAFNAEKQMIPFLSGESLFKNIHWFTPLTNDRGELCFKLENGRVIEWESGRFHAYYALDPADSERRRQTQKVTLSQSARVVAFRDMDTGRVFIYEARMDREEPSKIMYEMFDLHAKYEFVRMTFEENLFRSLFAESLEFVRKDWMNKNGYDLPLPMHSVWNSHKKEARIYSIEPDISAGRVLFSRYLPQNAITQLSDYPNCDHNDFLDAIELIQKSTNPRSNLKALNMSLIDEGLGG